PCGAGDAGARTGGGSGKWPNDVLLDDQKVCGILVERVHVASPGRDQPLAVVGIGLNVDQTTDELPVATATSLALAGGRRDRTELFAAMLRELDARLRTVSRTPGGFVARD